MTSNWIRVLVVLALTWLVTAVPVPVPAIDGGSAPAAVGQESSVTTPGSATPASPDRRVRFEDTPEHIEGGSAPSSPPSGRIRPAIRLPAGVESPTRSSSPVDAAGITSDSTSSDGYLARLLENRPLNVQPSKDLDRMTSHLPESDGKPILTLSGKSDLDSSALARMTDERVPFYVDDGKGTVSMFASTMAHGPLVHRSGLDEARQQAIREVLAKSRSPLSDENMARRLEGRPHSVYPSDELSKMVNKLPVFKERSIVTLSGNEELDSKALKVMTERHQPFYVGDGKGNIAAFVGAPNGGEGLVYQSEIGEDTRQGVAQALERNRLAAEASAVSSARTLQADGSALARGTSVPTQPRFRFLSPFQRPVFPQPAEAAAPTFKSWRTYVPFAKDPVQQVTTNMPRFNGVPVLRYPGSAQLQDAALERLRNNGRSFYAEGQDGSFFSIDRPVSHGSYTINGKLSDATQQEIRRALAKPTPSWWSRLSETAGNSFGKLSSSLKQYWHGA